MSLSSENHVSSNLVIWMGWENFLSRQILHLDLTGCFDWPWWILANGMRVAGGTREGCFFFTDYLSHLLLSDHSDSFNKYDKKLFLN